MESTTERLEVRREITIAARPETVWQFLVDPQKALLWWGIDARFDLRPGGEFRVHVVPGHTASGEFVEIDPPRRLVYTWGWEEGRDGPNLVPPGSSTIEIELEPTVEGTTLRFVHRDLPAEESVVSHGQGWDHYLGRLAVAAAGGDPGRDPWLEGNR
ncbi:MAG TPA: SRPBCC family protein [Gaiellaceae bacterium]|nr:SRPBCC family protein [Gaiellaceae bacterium]